MLSLTRKADYAIMAMAELARRDPDRVSARSLAESLRVPVPVMTGVLHQLRQATLIDSTLGGKGGYTLAREAVEISLAEIIEAIEGPIRLALCCNEENVASDEATTSCELEADCRIKEPVQRVHQGLRLFLEQVRLGHLISEQQPTPLRLALGASALSGVGVGSAESGCSCMGTDEARVSH